ncbi:MAG TPA: phytoene desaturase family protein, partial [Cyclobacteriaceae bacterium]|nr:phytoene desaturase family protein [Cyclobacteriaceae bacterium]
MESATRKKAAVIGAGFSSLSAATCLAQEGFDVTIFEKNSTAGGRCRKFEHDGFVFDMGPSWYWMPDVFEKYFARFGKKPSDYYELTRLDPSYRVFYSNHEVLDIPANLEELFQLFESLEEGSSIHLKKFLEEGAFKYEVGMNTLVYNPGLSITELFDTRLVKGLFKMQVFQSMASHVRSHFKDPRLIQILEFPVLFLGATAEDTPALYSLMNYADIKLGTWYPMGGMYKIIEGMVALAKEQGVRFEFDSPVEKFTMRDNEIAEIVIQGKPYAFDYVVSGADYHHVEQQLLPASSRKYSEAYWQKRAMAPSSLIFYLGVNKPLKNLQHHNLFFDADFTLHAKEIYTDPQWPTDPLFYVCCTSKTDNTVAPENQ